MDGAEELRATARVVALPMTTRFRGLTTREALLVHGPCGWAEWSPFAEYDDAEAAVWLRATIAAGWTPPPAALRTSIPVNATVPAVEAERVDEILARFPGCRTAKVKVADPAGTLADDVARVAAVRDVLGAEGRIRIDANAAWTVDEAERALRAIGPFDLEYAEQPCASVEELAELRMRIRDLAVPIAADESVRRAGDPLAVARAGAADLLVLKVQPLGGAARALEIAEEAGLPVVVSSALDTSVGLAAAARFAAALPGLPYDCGLGTAALLAADVTGSPLIPVDGAIPVRDVSPDPDLLDRWQAPPDRIAWWLGRLDRCAALLPAAPPSA